MTFEEALKKLAEKWPEKFTIEFFPMGQYRTAEFRWFFNARERIVGTIGWEFTQDDIDEILGMIGWEYDVYRYTVRGYAVNYRMALLDNQNRMVVGYSNNLNEIFLTKLEAAKAALIAVVERECQ